MGNKTIYIIRHGQTDFNLRGIVQGGGVDTSLNSTGRQQGAAFHKTYGHLPFEAVLTSTQKRTHETVKPFLDQGLAWEQFPEIIEMGWGDHEGKESTPDSRKEYRFVADQWNSGNYDIALANGETAQQLGARVQSFVEHVQQRTEELLLICCHGRTMRALMCILKQLPLSRMDDFSHTNTGLWIATQEDGLFIFHKENDTSHLLIQDEKGIRSLR